MLTSYSAWRQKVRNPTQLATFIKSGLLGTGEHWNSEWLSNGTPTAGAAPGAAAVPTSATAGALGQSDASGGQDSYLMFLRRFDAGISNGVSNVQMMVVDRLSHMSGLNATTITAQTVSTSALTRFTSGVDVWAAIEIYSAIGATGTTLTASYTNSAGTAGRTSPAITFGGAGFNALRTLLPISWQSGDVGVKSVQSVTAVATTGTAGNFGVTLFKTLWMGSCQVQMPYPHRGDKVGSGFFAGVPSGACLQLIQAGGGQSTDVVAAEFGFMET